MRPANLTHVYTGSFGCYGRLCPRTLYRGQVRKGERIIQGDSDHYALEAWERMTQGGLTPVDILEYTKFSLVAHLLTGALGNAVR